MSTSTNSQKCPICANDVMPNPRYPNYVCSSCLDDGVEVDGELVPLSSLDVHSQNQISCVVKGVQCLAREAHMGGVVILAQKADSQKLS